MRRIQLRALRQTLRNLVKPQQLAEEKLRIASVIDHTALKPEVTASDVTKLCREALLCSFASVCVNPFWVTSAVEQLSGSPVKVCTVVGFPLGANTSETKAGEARVARREGAQEIDMVLNVGSLVSGDYDQVKKDITAVADIVHDGVGLLKVILETCLLTDEQKSVACRIATEAGADFVKTSTGFSHAGATVEDVKLMRQSVGSNLGVKASGGIRTLASLESFLAAGATRIGTSAGVGIMKEVEGLKGTQSAGNY